MNSLDETTESNLSTFVEHKQLYGIRQLKDHEIRSPKLNPEATEFTIVISGKECVYRHMKDVIRSSRSVFLKEQKHERFFRVDGIDYPKLHKFDQVDGYVNTTKNVCIFGPCALFNPNSSQELVWICLWRGQCGKIVKSVVYDPVKRACMFWLGILFYRESWIFAHEKVDIAELYFS